MNISDFKKQLKLMERDLGRIINDTLPRKAGVIAVNHTRQNFRDGGFRDGGLHPWKPAKRQLRGDGRAGSRYGPLLSGRNRLVFRTPPNHGIVFTLTGREDSQIKFLKTE